MLTDQNSTLRFPRKTILQQVLGGDPFGPAMVALSCSLPSYSIQILIEAIVPREFLSQGGWIFFLVSLVGVNRSLELLNLI